MKLSYSTPIPQLVVDDYITLWYENANRNNTG